MRRRAGHGVPVLLTLLLVGCDGGAGDPTPTRPPEVTSVAVEVVDLAGSEDAVGTLVSFGLQVSSREDQGVLVPDDLGVAGPAESTAGVATLRVPFRVTSGGDDAPPQALGRVLPAGGTLRVDDDAVAVADDVTAVRVCVDVLVPVPAGAGPPDDDGVISFSVNGPVASGSACSTAQQLGG